MTETHPNVALLSQFDPTNLAGMAEVLEEGFVWHFVNPSLPEHHGDYVGLTGLQDFFKRTQGFSGGTFKIKPVSVTAIGDELVVVHVKDTMVFEGTPMEIDAVVVWRIVDGKLAEAWDIPAVHTPRVMGNANAFEN
ncbi:MAG: nuclear transport factor 2 family protein [Aeoliella sp.]